MQNSGKTKTGMKKPRKTGIVNLIHCSIMSKEYEYYTEGERNNAFKNNKYNKRKSFRP